MSAPARLRGLRLHGFKSFAEKTVVEFGPGISAVVGPNGSGKSNLADALRWTLGEQGRSLRIRKSEDVIWAGSERRAAQGMADVTLVVDNADGLLPVEYAEVELGRRLYRSGENDYLLNRQRVRLRDLVDLLDAAHLADNAFLFIGQGMVDQALALRPEERRPLFEEVAGVRRHERRRRRAEEQLAESEANLARVDDILAELRPQARRLAAQAEQQATRASAGDELAAGLVLAAHARWHEAAKRAEGAAARRRRAVSEAEHAGAALARAEAAVAALSDELASRADEALDRQAAHDAARSALEALRLREARAASELGALARDRDRLLAERDAASAEAANQRRALALPVPERDANAEAALGDAERALAEALAELGALRASRDADDAQRAAIRRAAAAREGELETARRRAADADRRVADELAQAATAGVRRAELEDAAARARAAVATAVAAEAAATTRRSTAAADLAEAEEARRAAAAAAAAAGEALAAAGARHAALVARIGEEEARGIARAARRHGGRRVDEELGVEPRFRAAVEAALGTFARGYVVARAVVPALGFERGDLVVADALSRDGPSRAAERAAEREADEVRARAAEMGGGDLREAIRRDPGGAAGSLLGRAVWVPDLAAALTLQPALPTGWLAVTLDGLARVGPETVSLGAVGDGTLDRRSEANRLAAEIEELETRSKAAAAGLAAAAQRMADARDRSDAASSAERRAREAARAAEDALRLAERDLESVAREAAWHEAQAARLAGEAERARSALDALAGQTRAWPEDGQPGPSAEAMQVEPEDALATWQHRAADLRLRRDRLAAVVAERDAARRAVEQERARAADADSALLELDARERALSADASGLAAELAAAEQSTAATRAALDALRSDESATRERLHAAEADVRAARDALRHADEQLRSADVADLEARLGLDALRESILVDLASLGATGRRHLEGAAGVMAGEVADAGERFGGEAATDDPAPLEDALSAAATAWSAAPPPSDPPSAARLGTLRRRYHELGAGNPFAVEEYAEVRARLESLDGQAADLRDAIGRTRRLIDELNAMIAGQFQVTFAALEAAFDARFRQLFGGGFAKLSLTEPENLTATGVEIVARPPGKKPQALAMLSGGERALTAVALLFAMLEIRPVPFCVLDEVDAALDEANVGRFTDALRGLADRIQFVVITHNRGTIEAADALYGVTVGDDSVSRVISLRLEEATALAERRAGSLVAAR